MAQYFIHAYKKKEFELRAKNKTKKTKKNHADIIKPLRQKWQSKAYD